jgi:hypothetical protein
MGFGAYQRHLFGLRSGRDLDPTWPVAELRAPPNVREITPGNKKRVPSALREWAE